METPDGFSTPEPELEPNHNHDATDSDLEPLNADDYYRTLILFSFGHRYDTPKLIDLDTYAASMGQEWTANLIIDARVVPNPSRAIRVNPGLSKTFQQTLFADPENEAHYQQFSNAIQAFCIAGAKKAECTKILRVGVGCQMGRHRSVAIVARMEKELPTLLGNDWQIVVRHRDIDKKNKGKAKPKP